MTTYPYHIDHYAIHSLTRLTELQLGHIVNALNEKVTPANGALSGRAGAVSFHLDGIGDVVLKIYLRGGVLGRIISRTYWGWGTPRCRIEMNQLLYAKSLGIQVPEPVCHVTEGRHLYKCWLILREITHCHSLSDLSRKNETEALGHMDDVRRQVRILIANKVRHVDLHPGNVLVGENGHVYLIDFDKAHFFSQGKQKLAACYTERWARAVRKYNLPDFLNEKMRNLL
ncbi:MAG: hypothetical protein KJ737_09820 [Proteobacteria bacterium]|nr:hypothetical protein [Pseudomonadota bacterium]